MGIFNDLGFKKNSSNEIVSPNSAKFNGKTFAECQTELVNRIKSDVILSTDADGIVSITNFTNVNKPDFFGDGSNVATYFFDGDVKDARGSYNGTVINGSYVTGRFGKAVVFNGSTNISITNLPTTLFNLNPTFSFSTWIKFSGVERNIFAFSNPSGATAYISTGQAGVTTTYGTCRRYFYPETLSDNNWHHILVTCSNYEMQIYIDGINKGITGIVTTTGLNSSTTNTLNIGLINGVYYTGQIDNVRIFNRVLSAAEVTSLYNEPIPQNILFQEATQNSWFKYKATAYDLTAGAKVFINGSEQVGTSTANNSDFFGDNSNIATYLMQNNLNDSLGLYNATPTNITYTTGRTNQGALFSSTSAATTNLTIPNIFSISFWIKPTLGIDRTNTIFGFNGDAPTYITGMVTSTTGLSIHRPGVTEVYTAANVLTLNAWNHVVLTCSSLTASTSNQKWYVNGVQVATTLEGAGDFNFGKFYFKPFTGILDTTRIFNRVLTTAEISKLYTDGAVSFNEVRTDTRKLDVVITGGSASKVDIELYTGEVL